MDLISVIVPIYNVEQYLDECVQSIVDQTYSNLEIILVDDGSPDNCPEMCDCWANRDERIKVIHKKNGGLSSARNAGLEIAKGDFIGFVDSDDILMPQMYEQLHLLFVKNKTLLVAGCTLMSFNKTGQYPFMKFDENVYFDTLIDIKTAMRLFMSVSVDASVCDKLFRRDFFEENRFAEGKTNEDWLFWYFSLKTFYNYDGYISLLKDSYYLYRQTEGSICNQDLDSTSKRLFFSIDNNSDLIIDDMKKWNPLLVEYILPFKINNQIQAIYDIKSHSILLRERRAECNEFISNFRRQKLLHSYYGKSCLFNLRILLAQYFPSLGIYLKNIRLILCSFVKRFFL